MRTAALAIADELASAQLPVPDRDITDSVELLRWLVDEHFTFLGYREYRLVDGAAPGEKQLRAVLGTGLGILRQDQPLPRTLTSMAPEAQREDHGEAAAGHHQGQLALHRAPQLATSTTSASRPSTRTATSTASGVSSGLFSSAAYLHSVRELPVVTRKVDAVLDRSGLSPRSHSGRDLLAVLEDYPRDELFQISTDDLSDTVLGVLRLAGRRQLRLFVRRDGYGRFISCLVFLPRDRFTTANRLAIQEILLRELHGVGVDYATRVGESPLARIHFIVRTDPASPPADDRRRGDPAAAGRGDPQLGRRLPAGAGAQARRGAVPRTSTTVTRRRFRTATRTSTRRTRRSRTSPSWSCWTSRGSWRCTCTGERRDDTDVRFKVYRHGEPMMLSAVLPVLHSLGVTVADERPYEVTRAGGTVHLYDFGLRLPAGAREIAEVQGAHGERLLGDLAAARRRSTASTSWWYAPG